jgi:TonB family protein
MRPWLALVVSLLASPAPAPAQAPPPGCEAQAASEKPIATLQSMSFPVLASRFGIEGWAEVRTTIAPDGSVSAVAVLASEPEGTFDETARREVAKWRYCPDPTGPSAPPRSATMRLRFQNAERRTLPIPAQCEPGEAWVLVRFDLELDGTVDDIAVEQSCPPGVHDAAAIEEVRTRKYLPDVPQRIPGARELFAIEGKILEQPNVSRLSRL